MDRMRSVILGAAATLALAWCADDASACAGPAANAISIAFDGQKFTVTNTSRQWVQVDFGAYGATYNLQLGPGQSEIPRSPGMFTRPMYGYDSCVATPMTVSQTGVATLQRSR